MADLTSVLTVGCVQQMFTSGGDTPEEPVVQCLQIKPMQSQQNVERYRVVFSDSRNFIQSMLAAQMNFLVTEGKLTKGQLCKLKEYQPNIIKDKPVLVVLNVEPLEQYGENEKIGQPVGLDMFGADKPQAVKPANQAGNDASADGPQQNGGHNEGQQTAQRALPSRSSAKGTSHGTIYPIEALSPYTNKWTIKARCTAKGEIKHWHNKNGEGKLFSANFLDATGEIRATGFNDSVEQWYDFLQEGSVYYISCPCRVQIAKRQFSNVNNDYELTFERDTVIEKADDNEGVPEVTYNFTNLEALQSVEKDTTIDTIGVLRGVGEMSEITSKTTNKPFSKRELTIVDNTGYEVRLTIWGKTAAGFNAEPNTVIAFKGVKVSDFGGRSLSLLSSGSMTLNPDVEEGHFLKGWYNASDTTDTFRTHTEMLGAATNTNGAASGKNAPKTIEEIRDSNIGMGEEAEYFSVKATVIYVKKESFAYPACQTERCNKKVVEIDPGQWRCEKCDITWPRPTYRYILSVNVADHTGMLWLSCFDEVGQMIMGRPADDVQAAREEGDDTLIEEFFRDANCQTLIFRARAKMDTYGDEQRIRYQVVSANKPNFVQEAKTLTKLIAQYKIDDDSLFVN